MQKQTLTFDQLPEYIYELGRKVDQLTTLLSAPAAATSLADEVGGLKLAQEVTRLSAARIYTLVSERKLPHKKRGNRLTFRRSELLDWLEEGKRETIGGPIV